ncbi:MAG TPA: hypothetical protein VFA89_07525 [Terriglobales bacterium]|nr:hypothetical protein [Terriglobales bacterium]
MSSPDWDQDFSQLFSEVDDREPRAPSSLKARLYSSLVREQQCTGPLASLSATVASGRGVCVFEKLVEIAPIGEKAKSPFFCSTCHARILAENFDNPPIFWSHCPYVNFRKT